jgi:hypothetical protein
MQRLGYKLDKQGSILSKSREFVLPFCDIQTSSDPHSLLLQGAFSLGLKHSGHETDCSPPLLVCLHGMVLN